MYSAFSSLIVFGTIEKKMSLLDLPPDLLLAIADFTPEPSLNALLQTSSSLYSLLNVHLYRHNVRYSRSSALLSASLYGNLSAVRKLLAQNAHVNTTTTAAVVPRRWRRRCASASAKLVHLPPSVTVAGGSVMLRSLRHELRDCLAKGRPPATPLLYATAGGHVDIMVDLIAHGADVHCISAECRHSNAGRKWCCHRTPVMMAADRGHAAALELLLRHGADVNAAPAKCNSPLGLAAASGQVDTVRTLLRHGADVNTLRRGGTPLIKAVRARRGESVRVLLEEGNADVNIPDDFRGFTALFWAARDNDSSHLIPLLLQLRPEQRERRDSVGRTPLALAAWEGWIQPMQCLLAHGACVNAANRTSQTPLWWAVLADGFKATTTLLEHGADTEIEAPWDGEIMPVLLMAMLRFHYSIVEVLLDHGADPNCRSSPADTSASRSSGSAAVRVRGGTKTPLWLAVRERETSLVRKLLHHGAHPDLRAGRCESSPLYWAIDAGHVCIATILLDNGADPNAPVKLKGKGKMSPLCYAMQRRQYSIARCLVDHGADPNEPGWDGGPLLVKATTRENVGLIQAMLQHGACPNVRDASGKSPLFLAGVKGNHLLVRMLEAHGGVE